MATTAPVVAALALFGCGSSPSSDNGASRETSKELTAVTKAVSGLDPRERRAKLAQLAEREGGEVTVYHTLNGRAMGPLVAEFSDKYDIDVNNFETSASDLLQRVGQESKAGLKAVDVVETGGPEMFALANDGVFADYRSPYQAKLGRGAVQKGWTTDRFSNFTIAWNTDRVKPGEQPKTWEELAEPKWKGRISLSSNTVGVSWYKTLRDYWVKSGTHSAAESDQIFEKIARNSTAIPGTNEQLELLARGEFDVSVAVGTGSVEGIKDDGGHIDWKPPLPEIVRLRQGAGLVRDAPHAASAMLFLDYLFSDGQDILAKARRDPSRSDLEVAPRGTKLLVVDLKRLAPQQEEWAKRWDRIVSLARQGKG